MQKQWLLFSHVQGKTKHRSAGHAVHYLALTHCFDRELVFRSCCPCMIMSTKLLSRIENYQDLFAGCDALELCAESSREDLSHRFQATLR